MQRHLDPLLPISELLRLSESDLRERMEFLTESGWDEDEHPRGPNGEFISKDGEDEKSFGDRVSKAADNLHDKVSEKGKAWKSARAVRDAAKASRDANREAARVHDKLGNKEKAASHRAKAQYSRETLDHMKGQR
jgi:hypothetical protein